MNPTVLAILLRGALSAHRGRLALSALAIALGVALAAAVQTLHDSALAEVDRAARALAGTADVEIRGPRSGFDDQLFIDIAREPRVAVASPVLEIDTAVAGTHRPLRILGIDPFRAARLQPAFGASGGGFGAAPAALGAASAWLSAPAATRHRVKAGDTLRVRSGLQEIPLRVAGLLPGLDAGEVALVDIAAAQHLFDRLGRITRIDLRLREGVDAGAFRRDLAEKLPAGVMAVAPAGAAGRAATLTRAYRVNLNALALVALATGLFLVASTLALQAARRRQSLALLRALGLSRRALLTLLATEGALLGAVGASLGLALGLGAAWGLLRRGSADLGAGYFRGLEAGFAPDPVALAAIALLGIATAAGGAWLVARRVASHDIAAALRDRDEDIPVAGWRPVILAIACLAGGGALLAAPAVAGLPLGGYAAIALWLAGTVLLVGPASRAALSRVAPGERPLASLALAQVRHLPGHLAASLAGIVVSVSLCVAMAIMVHSFRVSLEGWIRGVLGADLYVRASSAGDAATFSAAEQARLAALPGIARLEPLRYDRLTVGAGAEPVTLLARPVDAAVLSGFQVTPSPALPQGGGSASFRPPGGREFLPPPWGRAGEGVHVWISEAAADLQGWRTGETIALPIAGRAVDVKVAGTFRDYARTWGAVLMDLADYRALTGDTRANDLALHLAPGTTPAQAMAAVRAALPGATGLEFAEAAEIHAMSLRLFDRTFAATYALEAVAIGIALLGVTSSFAALAWARRREFGVLRHLGLARRDVLRMLALEGLATGAAGALAGLLAGVAISLVLVHVVNRQSFHWGMEVHWPLGPLAVLLVAVVALCGAGAGWSARAAVRDDAIRAVKDDA